MRMGKYLMAVMMAALLLALGAPDVQASKTVKIGVILPLTGQLSLDGTHEANGVKMAVEDINAKGGIKIGKDMYKVELLVYDDQGVPKESVAAMEKLVTRDGVKMVIGSYTSSSTFAIMPIAQREKVVLCSPNSAAAKLTQVGNKWFFRGGVTVPGSAYTLSNFIKSLGIKTIVHLSINDDYGRNMAASQKEEQEKLGVKVIAQEFYDHGSTDFYPVLTKIKAMKPEAIFDIMETKACSIYLRQAKEIVPEIKLVDAGGADPYMLMKLAPDALDNFYPTSRGPAMDDPVIAPVVKRYRDKYKMDPMSYVFSGYDVMMMYKNAMESAGTTEDTEKIREAMTKTNYQGLLGNYYFDKNNENSLVGWVGSLKGGKLKLWKIAK